MFAAHFATDPTRQRLHERVAADWLQNTPSIENFELLPSSRKAGLYVTSDGEIRIGGENAPGKSLDFRWTVGEITYLASHKYTKESGGAQDQQFAEMLSLLRRFQNCQQKGYVLIVIVDGTYYTGRKMQALQNATRDHDPRSFASHIENVPDIINRLHNE